VWLREKTAFSLGYSGDAPVRRRRETLQSRDGRARSARARREQVLGEMSSWSMATPARKAEKAGTSLLTSLFTSEMPIQRQGVASLGSIRERAVGRVSR
jgi:hypothetical protein